MKNSTTMIIAAAVVALVACNKNSSADNQASEVQANAEQRRQCDDATLRTLVTPGSVLLPFSAETGEGIPHRTIASSRPSA